MESLSYIFRAGHRVTTSLLILLALFFCSDAFSHSGKGIDKSTFSNAADEWFYTIKASDGRGGDISPKGDVFVWANSNITFEMDPDRRKEVEDVKVDGESVGPVSSYTFLNINSDHTISVTFRDERFTITASAGIGGSITPSGIIEVKRDGKAEFAIKADRDYEILDVIVDGESKGAIKDYKFSKVKADHTITAIFSPTQFTITATAGTGGSIAPSGDIEVKKGDDMTFSIHPNTGYEVLDVVVDGESEGPVTSYRFSRVVSDHTIDATFHSTVEILNVSIPNESMKIGDVVNATITVNDDEGNPFTLISGSVGGYVLEGFQRISATTYRANFTINQGGNSFTDSQDIPVSNLVLSNGSAQSAPYNQLIIQNDDPLDASLPVISSAEVEGGTKKVGDVVHLTIRADGLNYSIHPLSNINAIAASEPNISFTESGGGNYVLNYTVQEGDRDVGTGTLELEASIILVKPSGNMGIPYSTISNISQLTIDAHAPVVVKMEVPSREVGVGGTVVVQVTADGIGYSAGTGTMVNEVQLSSPRVSVTELSTGLYELSYLVGIEDAAVPSGDLQVGLVMVDVAGNLSETYLNLDPNSLEIYTDLPEAAFGETPPICEGEDTEVSILLSGRAPWSFDLQDGSTTTSFTNITSSNYNLTVAPEQTTTYQISLVRDVNGVENTNTGNTQVTVNERPEVEILNLATGYNLEADPVKLEANVMGGIFSGPGVVSATGYFYPALADTVDSPHNIYYTYENTNGCISTTSKLVYVLGAKGAVLIPDHTVCLNDVPFTASVMNVPQASGSFRLLNSNSQEIDGLTDHGDNTATINPALLNSDNYTIEYQYLDQVILFLRKTFTIESASQPQILNLTEESYCQNAAPFKLQSNLADVLFEGQGISGNLIDGFTLYPREADPGTISITCTSYSENGCTASQQQNVNILFAPEVNFELSTECIPEGGEIVSFDNQTIGKAYIETWSWDFGDIGSGQDNLSNLVNPTHHYQAPGEQSISLTAITFEGCVTSYLLETTIDSKPVADFTWLNECFTPGSDVKFINRTSLGFASLDSVIWTFRSGSGDLLGEIGSKNIIDTVAFPFETADAYQVRLYTLNKGGCFDELTREIVLRPTIQLDHEGFSETFDDSEGQWTIHSEDRVESWVWGVPEFTGHTPVEGDHAWYTRLPSGVSTYRENSWIQSPCFDFTDMERPLIQMDLMRSFAPGISGAVLQYRDGIEEGWKTVGENTPGIEWYNDTPILNKPGGSSLGWSLDEFNPDSDWVTAVHDLDQVVGKANVAFRVAIAANGVQGMNNQGFAFNNVVVAERTKIAILEHFTSNSSDTSRLADDIIDEIGKNHSRDVIDLQYHMDIGAMDPMNENNPLSSSTRSFNYGVPKIPFTVLDGGADTFHRYDFSALSKGPVEDHLRLITLELPAFDIDLSVNWMETGLEANTLITCSSDRYDNHIQLYLVVFETAVTAYSGRNGDTEFRNVVLDMLPSPAGRLLGDSWRKGRIDDRTHTWSYKPYVEDLNDLAVVAFIQDRTTGKILQAAVDYKDETVGILKPLNEVGSFNIYPNPSQSYIYVNLGTRSEHVGRIELIDVNGKVVFEEHLPAGYQVFQLDLDPLSRGLYILRWIESDQIRGVSKVVKSR